MEKLNFDLTTLKYSERDGNLSVESNSNPPSTKYFPIFGDKIFKPLSYTKPLTTPLFSYGEVFWSYYIKKYFYKDGLNTNLAICEGIREHQPKYREIGILVDSYLSGSEQDISLYEYFNMYPDDQVNISKYINYCMEFYNYIPIFSSELIKYREDLGESLALLYLISVLTMNENFHYENIRFISDKYGEVLKLNPPFDHEFSLPFLFPDVPVQNTFYFLKYMRKLEENEIVGRNLKYIAKHYPNVCLEFLDGLTKFAKDIEENPVVIENNSFIGKVSTREYEIYQARFHHHDEETARKLMEEIKFKEINYEALYDTINKEIQKNNQMLEEKLGHMLKLQ